MRRAPAWMAAIGVLLGWLAEPAAAHAASVWVTLAAGLPGSETPASSSEFFFDNPHAPYIAINELSGGVTAEATTGGGSSFFGGTGTPVLLNLADGSAYIASGSAPTAAKTAGAGGGTPASTAPVAGGTVPSNAALLGVALAEPTNGLRALTATVTDSAGNSLGTGSLTVPEEGWWVIGLSPGSQPTPDPGPILPPPPVDPGPVPIPEPVPVNRAPSSPGGGAVATPEPGTLLLVAIGAAAVHAWRRSRPRIAST